MSTTTNRNLPLDALRTLLTLLVVLHHAALAYVQFAPPRATSLDTPMLLWAAFPVLDAVRWKGLDLLTTFDDTFLMALMFLLSGVFVPASLARKGAAAFLRDRARKLGVAFVVAAGVLAPLAYYAAYRAMAPQKASFWQQWLHLGVWPAGPAWFLWVLLAFDLVAAGLFALAPRAFAGLGRFAERIGDRPVRALLALLAASGVAYLVMTTAFDALRWVSFGPFFVQIGRIGLYLVFFVAGMALGERGIDAGILAPEGPLARRWAWWSNVAPFVFMVALVSWLAVLGAIAKGPVSPVRIALANAMYPLTCTVTSFAVLAVGLRFLRRPSRLVARLVPNAFGIYITHYVFVAWLQLAMLRVTIAAPAKLAVVFLGAVLGAWALTAAVRRTASALRTRRANVASPLSATTIASSAAPGG